jgi:hypothetical protein
MAWFDNAGYPVIDGGGSIRAQSDEPGDAALRRRWGRGLIWVMTEG